jgi:hypothetical protein
MKRQGLLVAAVLAAAVALPLGANASAAPTASPSPTASTTTAPGSTEHGPSRLVPVTAADDCTIIRAVSHAPYTTPDGSQWDAWTYSNGTVGLVEPGGPAPDPVCINTEIPPHGALIRATSSSPAATG